MKNNWSEKDAKQFIRKYTSKGYTEDIAYRVYTTQLLGNNPKLVLHGGGNTSVKTVARDLDSKKYDVLCVKGSGWDMGDIEPEGLPAVKLKPMLSMIKQSYQITIWLISKRNLLDTKSPNPSVETFLHAFLPHSLLITLIRRNTGHNE